MKRVIIFVSFCCCVAISACTTGEAQPNTKPASLTLECSIQNTKSPNVILFKEDVVLNMPIDQAGKFGGTFEGIPSYYEFIFGRDRFPIYLTGDGTFKANLDARNLANSTFEGGGAAESYYLIDKIKLKRKITSNIRTTYKLPEAQFLVAMEGEKQDYLDLLNSKEGLSKSFVAAEKQNIDFLILSTGMEYESAHGFLTEQMGFQASPEFKEKFAHSDFSNEAMFSTIPDYRGMVIKHFVKPDLAASVQGLDQVESSLIKDVIIGQVLSEVKPGIKDLDATMNKLISLCSSEKLKSELQKRYQALKSVDTGSPSPSFTYQDINGKTVSLDGLKGKNVYIDVWATWCGPCKREIPHLQQLEKDYHGKNVEFVSISVDTPDKEAAWKKMINDKAMSGVQLITGNGWDSPFIKQYMISSIPRFLLIDAEGKIVSSNAPRPSSGSVIRKELDNLL